MTRPFLPRRTFLKGLGLTIGLPALEAMTPALAPAKDNNAKDNNPAPVRTAYVFFPNGAIMPAWTPKDEGASYTLSETLIPLQNYTPDFNVYTGLAQDEGRAKGDGPGDHARCASTYLTGAHPFKTAGANIKVGVSVDQVAAEQIGELTKLPSLELGVERGRNAGNCDSGYSCAYSSNISWKTATTPMAKETKAKLAFERLFGAGGEKDETQRERDFFRKSILDFVAADAKQLQRRLGQTDRRKIEEYFTSVRELETRIARAEADEKAARPDYKIPENAGDRKQQIRLMYDLIVLAFQTDTTRIATFMLGNAGSNASYPMVGVNDGHHSISHHRNEEGKVSKLRQIDRFFVDQFAYFLGKLKAVEENGSTLLDNSMIVYGSGLGDGNRHDHAGLPVLLAGRGGGRVKTGSHIKLSSETPLNNLFVSMLSIAGAKVEKVGDSSGKLGLS